MTKESLFWIFILTIINSVGQYFPHFQKNYTLDMIADDLEEEVEVIRPIYEKAKLHMDA